MQNFTKKLILIDQDQVLADFELGFYRAVSKLREMSIKQIELKDRNCFYAGDQYEKEQGLNTGYLAKEKDFFRKLPVIPGAIEGIKYLDSKYQVKIVTAPILGARYCLQEKYDWILDNLGESFCNKIIITQDKTIIAGDYLIDDKPNIVGLMEPTWRHLLFESCANKHLDMNRFSWKDIVDNF